MDGWIKLHRSICNKSMWLDEPFSRGQAWIDLLMLAQYQKGHIRTRKGVRIDLERGQVGMSEEKISERWKWSRGKARRFLKELELDGRIVQRKDKVKNIISICNYEEYQSADTPDEQETVHATDIERTLNGQGTDTNKNVKKDKEGKEEDIKNNTKKTKPKKRASQIPEDWEHPKECVDYCEINYPLVDSHAELERFADHWRSKGETRKDWFATWRNWLRSGYDPILKSGQKKKDGKYTFADQINDTMAWAAEQDRLNEENDL